VRRLPAILLLIAFAALGSGLLEGLHLRTHLAQQSAAAETGTTGAGHDQGDGDGCELCVNLHVGRISAGFVPVMICLGVFVAFLTQLAPRLAPQRVAARIDCRGPPVL
jgi:hypothetical protein